MAEFNITSYNNGMTVHYFENDDVPCHVGVINGNYRYVDNVLTDADVLQLNTPEGPTVLEGVPHDDSTEPADNTFHMFGSCPRIVWP